MRGISVLHACDKYQANCDMKNSVTFSVEILAGTRAIAEFLGTSPRQVAYWNEQGRIPCFRIGKTICARPETLRQWLKNCEAGQS